MKMIRFIAILLLMLSAACSNDQTPLVPLLDTCLFSSTSPVVWTGTHSGGANADFGGDAYAAGGAQITPDGGVVLVGYAKTSSQAGAQNQIALARFNPDGSLDSGFGTNGKVLTSIGTGDSLGYGSALQSDGRLLVAGTYLDASSANHLLLLRYNTDGSLDTTFGAAGVVEQAIGISDEATSVTLSPDGGILLSGYSSSAQNQYQFVAVRYSSDGVLDTSYGAQGTSSGFALGVPGLSFGATLDSAGDLVLSGFSSSSPTEIAVSRFTPNGLLDSSFGGTGQLQFHAGSGASASFGNQVAANEDILSAGYGMSSGKRDWAITRNLADGRANPLWGQNGVALIDVDGGSDSASRISEQCDGNVLVAGVAGSHFAAVRLTSTGELDTTFAQNGAYLSSSVSGSSDAILPLGTGQILVTGEASIGGHQDFYLIRLNGDGSLDTSYGN